MLKKVSSLLVGASASLTMLLTPAPGFGEDTAGFGQQEITLEQAVARAVAHSPAVAGSADASRAADARVAQARTAWWPRMQVSAAYRYAQPVPELSVDTGMILPGQTDPLSFSQEVGTEHSASASAQIAWGVLDFGARSSNIDAATLEGKAARNDQASRRADIAWAARRAYITASFFEATVHVTEVSLSTTHTALENVQNARDAGLASEVDVARAQTRVAELERRKIEAVQRKEQAVDSLHVLLGLDDDAALTLRDSLEDATVDLGPVADPTNTPELQAIKARRAALDARLGAVRSGWFPTLDLVLQGAYGYPRTFIETEPGFSGSAGAQLTWNIFDGGMRSAQTDELQARASELAHAQAAKSDDVDRRRREARAELRIARSSLEAADAQLRAAQAYLRSAQSSRQAGLSTRLDVLQAEQSVDQARLAQVQARRDGAFARADLLRANGVSVFITQPEDQPTNQAKRKDSP